MIDEYGNDGGGCAWWVHSCGESYVCGTPSIRDNTCQYHLDVQEKERARFGRDLPKEQPQIIDYLLLLEPAKTWLELQAEVSAARLAATPDETLSKTGRSLKQYAKDLLKRTHICNHDWETVGYGGCGWYSIRCTKCGKKEIS